MHTDEGKRFDKRNIARNIKNGVINQKDYEIYLSKIPDASDKIFNPEEPLPESYDIESDRQEGHESRKRGGKKKVKGKGR
jgi:hypothetical protein